MVSGGIDHVHKQSERRQAGFRGFGQAVEADHRGPGQVADSCGGGPGAGHRRYGACRTTCDGLGPSSVRTACPGQCHAAPLPRSSAEPQPSPPPQFVVGWLKPVQQKGIRIMRGLNRTNRVGPLSIHRRRIHRCGDKEVDEVFSGDFSLVHSYQR